MLKRTGEACSFGGVLLSAIIGADAFLGAAYCLFMLVLNIA